MPAKPGERARETGTFHCAGCGHKVDVKKGEKLPKCPCGEGVYDRRTNEPKNA